MKSLSVRCLFGNMKVEKLGKNCQEFWTSWFKYEDNYVAKATFVRGECIFDWSDS